MVSKLETDGSSAGNHRFLLEEPLETDGAPNGILEDDALSLLMHLIAIS